MPKTFRPFTVNCFILIGCLFQQIKLIMFEGQIKQEPLGDPFTCYDASVGARFSQLFTYSDMATISPAESAAGGRHHGTTQDAEAFGKSNFTMSGSSCFCFFPPETSPTKRAFKFIWCRIESHMMQ